MSDALHEGQSYYALEALSGKRQSIIVLAESMATGRARVEKYLTSDKLTAQDHYLTLKTAHGKLVEDIRDCRLFLSEIGDEALSAYADSLAGSVSGFNLMTPDYGTFAGAVMGFAEKLPVMDTVDASVIARCMNAVRMGHYPTDLENVGHIMKGIAFPDGITTNLFDPCCGEGKALKKLAVGNNCFTYGVELDEGRAEAAQSELHRVGIGSFFHSRISHEAFHSVLLNPPYLSVLTEGGGRAREEKRFLIETLPHLMMGGLMIYIVPYYRLTPDICRILCDNLADISVHRFTGDEFAKWSQVVVMGKRIKRIDGSVQADALAELAYKKDDIPYITEIADKRYALPAMPKKVDIFKGAVFNVVELTRQLKQSKSFDSLLAPKPQTTQPLSPKSCSIDVRRPPLPFTFSQLGLIGGSGLINGLIDCDSPHIIKGRIVKEAVTESTENRDRSGKLISTEVKEKIVNKMIFNVLTPDGFKSLA